MGGFWSSALANFIGSLAAGVLLGVVAYFFVTRRLQIIQPRRERIGEQLMVCDLLIAELGKGLQFVKGYRRGAPIEERLEMHAWDALKGSQSLRFLPIDCVQPVLKAYAHLYVLEHFFLSVEKVEMKEWTSGDSRVKSGASRLGEKMAAPVAIRLARADEACTEAINALTAERDRLRSL
jgi:hypothetical protein